MAIDAVKDHINSGRFGKRCVYIITGLRVAHKSFAVTDETTRTTSVSFGGSASATACGVPIPVEVGADISRSSDRTKAASYETAPGIVFAYRVHVIRPKGASGEAELFSDRTAFFSGEVVADDDDETEFVDVDESVLLQDLDGFSSGHAEDLVSNESSNKPFIVFRNLKEKREYTT